MSLKLNRAWVQVDRAQTRSPSERLKRRLFELAEQVGQPGPKGTFIARRLSEVAAEVGVRDEDAGWFASEQIKAGLLRVNRSGLWVVDPAQWEVV